MSDDEKNYIRIIIEFIIKFPFSHPKWFLLLCLLLLFGLIGLHFYQKTCSDYPCPDGYIKDESKKDIKCDSLTCNESDDKNTCCNEKQKCNKYRCPSGYADKDNSDKIYCKDSVCNETDDKNTCCNESIDCEGNWSDFSECSVECGGGTQTRTYNITTQPQYGGSPCPTSSESQACNTDACVPVDDIGIEEVINSEWCPDLDSNNIIDVGDLLSLLGSYGDTCNGDNQNKCLPNKRGTDENINVNELLTLLSKYNLDCTDSLDCTILQNNIESMRGVSGLFSNNCTSEECDVRLTCNADTEIFTDFTCNDGYWTHQGTTEEENRISECIGN